MKDALSVQTAKPTVDIVIVSYNNLTMLDRCVSSIKAKNLQEKFKDVYPKDFPGTTAARIYSGAV